MATLRERILDYLASRPEGASSAEIAREVGVDDSDAADRACQLLAEEGLVERRRVGRALLNLLTGDCERPQP